MSHTGSSDLGRVLVLNDPAVGPVKQALRSDHNQSAVELVSAAAAPGEEDAVVILAVEGRRWSLHRGERRHGNASLTLTASAVPPAGAVPSSPGGAAVHAGGVPADSALVVTSGGGAALFAGAGQGLTYNANACLVILHIIDPRL